MFTIYLPFHMARKLALNFCYYQSEYKLTGSLSKARISISKARIFLIKSADFHSSKARIIFVSKARIYL